MSIELILVSLGIACLVTLYDMIVSHEAIKRSSIPRRIVITLFVFCLYWGLAFLTLMALVLVVRNI